MSSGLFMSSSKEKGPARNQSSASSAWDSQSDSPSDSDKGHREQRKPAPAHGWAAEWQDIDDEKFSYRIRHLRPTTSGSPSQERLRGRASATPRSELLVSKQLRHNNGNAVFVLEIWHVLSSSDWGGRKAPKYQAHTFNMFAGNKTDDLEANSLPQIAQALENLLRAAGVNDAAGLAAEAYTLAKAKDSGEHHPTINHVSSTTSMEIAASQAVRGSEAKAAERAEARAAKELKEARKAKKAQPGPAKGDEAEKSQTREEKAPQRSSLDSLKKGFLSPGSGARWSSRSPPDGARRSPPSISHMTSALTKGLQKMTTSASSTSLPDQAKPKRPRPIGRHTTMRSTSGFFSRGKKAISKISTRPGSAAGPRKGKDKDQDTNA